MGVTKYLLNGMILQVGRGEMRLEIIKKMWAHLVPFQTSTSTSHRFVNVGGKVGSLAYQKIPKPRKTTTPLPTQRGFSQGLQVCKHHKNMSTYLEIHRKVHTNAFWATVGWLVFSGKFQVDFQLQNRRKSWGLEGLNPGIPFRMG